MDIRSLRFIARTDNGPSVAIYRCCQDYARRHIGRLIRFGLTGGVAGIVQLVVLQALVGVGWHDLPANSIGILAGTQVNFVLSALFIWRDRDIRGHFPRRWAEFHLATLTTTALNLLVFTIAGLFVPRLVAALLGIGAGGVINYLIEDSIVFRPAHLG